MQYLAHYLVAVTALNAGSALAAPISGSTEDCDTWAGQKTGNFKAFNKAVATSDDDTWQGWKKGNWFNSVTGITDTTSSPEDSADDSDDDSSTGTTVVETITSVVSTSSPVATQQQNVVDSSDDSDNEDDESSDDNSDNTQSTPVSTTEAPAATTEPPASTSAPASSGSSGSGSAPNSADQSGLDATNQFRAAHSADPLTWDSRLADAAAQLANSCVWGHNTELGGGGYGQNLYGGGGDIADAVGAWADEAAAYSSYYGSANLPSSVFESVGHFTQLVWKGTTKMGCARSACNNGYGGMVVCNYEPAGNFAGQYASNVAAS